MDGIPPDLRNEDPPPFFANFSVKSNVPNMKDNDYVQQSKINLMMSGDVIEDSLPPIKLGNKIIQVSKSGLKTNSDQLPTSNVLMSIAISPIIHDFKALLEDSKTSSLSLEDVLQRRSSNANWIPSSPLLLADSDLLAQINVNIDGIPPQKSQFELSDLTKEFQSDLYSFSIADCKMMIEYRNNLSIKEKEKLLYNIRFLRSKVTPNNNLNHSKQLDKVSAIENLLDNSKKISVVEQRNQALKLWKDLDRKVKEQLFQKICTRKIKNKIVSNIDKPNFTMKSSDCLLPISDGMKIVKDSKVNNGKNKIELDQEVEFQLNDVCNLIEQKFHSNNSGDLEGSDIGSMFTFKGNNENEHMAADQKFKSVDISSVGINFQPKIQVSFADKDMLAVLDGGKDWLKEVKVYSRDMTTVERVLTTYMKKNEVDDDGFQKVERKNFKDQKRNNQFKENSSGQGRYLKVNSNFEVSGKQGKNKGNSSYLASSYSNRFHIFSSLGENEANNLGDPDLSNRNSVPKVKEIVDQIENAQVKVNNVDYEKEGTQGVEMMDTNKIIV
ncbi:hypothetical protein L2E82_11087 [Cichorium intybus]|uniref:Uncharacterized protein n=1 Tax=Cichorium intybus TaxID=13427 RepID=A0ACB9GC74_CICIN|nr:hypothetical protein L2E82_11087 [Cichorium intybus]